MRRLRLRLTIRRLALLIVLVALGLVGWRVYREGPEAYWLVLKLRYGNVEARRSAAHTIGKAVGNAWMWDILGEDTAPIDPVERQGYIARRRERENMIFSALLQAANDPDPECRARALIAAGSLAAFRPDDIRRSQVLRQALIAFHDADPRVRVAGLGALTSHGESAAALRTLLTALADPSLEVQEAAITGLAWHGVRASDSQAEIALILAEILASQRDDRLRIAAAWSMSLFGVDHRRQSATGPDVIPAILGALYDSKVEVRRAAAQIVSGTTLDNRSQVITSWNSRKNSIIPACREAMKDADQEVRDYAAMALFWMGVRDPEVTTLLEQEGKNPDLVRGRRFKEAVSAWKVESESQKSRDPALGEKD